MAVWALVVMGACNMATLDSNLPAADSDSSRAVTGSNGSIDVTNMTGTNMTVTYNAGTRLTFARLYVSQGNGTGLVLANKDMTYNNGVYTYTFKHASFTSGAKIYLTVLKNLNGVESCVPQGTLANTTSWAWVLYGTTTSSSGSSSGGSTGGSTSTDATTPAIAGYNIAWADEFNGTALNTGNWVYDIGTGSGGWGNNEQQYYTSRSQNIGVSAGQLRITALKENYGGMAWTSARIKTQGKKEFKYGRIEARMKMPNGTALWPALWMLGSNFASAGWPYCGEIDIMEHVNSDATVYGTLHWDSGGYATWGRPTNNNYWNNFGVDVTQWHVYRIDWDASMIKWYVDGVQFMEANIANSVNSTEEFHKAFFFLINLAVGGQWPGYPNSTTPTSSSMYVDYLRVYQK
jgi:beta-glucanase (GH16 family)